MKQNKRGKFIKVKKTQCHDVVVAIDVDLDDGVVVAGREVEQEVLMFLLDVNKNKRGKFIKVEKTPCYNGVVASYV